MNEPATMQTMLSDSKTIAVVGLSADATKPSHYVSSYMQEHGYKLYPVNPSIAEVLGEKSFPSLTALQIKPDVVNVFRLAYAIPAIVDEMLALGLRNLWVQQGIFNAEAAARAEAGGIHVVMDRCILAEHRRLMAG